MMSSFGSALNTGDSQSYMMVGAIVLMLLIFVLYTPFMVIVALAVLAVFIYNRTQIQQPNSAPPATPVANGQQVNG